MQKNIPFTVFVLMIMIFHSAKDVEPATKQQSVYKRMICQKSLRNLSGQIILSVSPSYWADVPGQFKAFIDRCTPWCNTHEPHAKIHSGKKGYVIALRTGPNVKECNRIIESIEHFYGHMEVIPSGNLGLCSIEYKEAVQDRVQEIEAFCTKIE